MKFDCTLFMKTVLFKDMPKKLFARFMLQISGYRLSVVKVSIWYISIAFSKIMLSGSYHSKLCQNVHDNVHSYFSYSKDGF